MSCTIVIKTNSHYKYLWDIINDLTKELSKVLLFVDDTLDYKFNDNIEVLKYDANLAYSDRISYLIENLDTDYFILSHDIDLIINFDEDKLKKYLEIVKDYNIDRLSLGVFNPSDLISEKIVRDDLSICQLVFNMSRNFFTPFDYSPSIYKKDSIYKFYKNFPGISYKELELYKGVQDYFKDNLSAYGIQKTYDMSLVYHRGFVYTSDFNFLHITVAGSLLEDESYFDLKDKFIEIKDKYNLGFLPTSYSGFIGKNEL